MKLDNIIYDVESLASAISEQWNIESPTFKAMYPSDTATALVNGMAAYGAMLQYCIVSAMANCYTTTAFSDAAIYQLASTLGNNLHGNVSAQVKANITKNNFIGMNIIIPAESQFMIGDKKFFNPNAIICPANVETVTDITFVQGEFLTVTKTTSGIENEKFYFSTDFKCNHNYISVSVNGEEWNVAESFLEYDKGAIYDPSQMNVCVLKTDPDGKSYIKVGNNQLGNMPISGSTIQIKYASNDGEAGNISESNATGYLITNLSYLNSAGTAENLNITLTTTTTSYGGFSKQSTTILRETSPYVFASGNRAIRRQDYESMLLNKCGYLAASVWGEYEEANRIGTYDALMMNMVYYTGVKSFQTYPYFILGQISDKSIYGGNLNSTRGFWGSFSFKVINNTNTTKSILIQDTGGKGQLFINNNSMDPRDSLLPDWKNAVGYTYIARLDITTPIAASGSGYRVNDELIIQNTGNQLTLRITQINEVGSVLSAALTKYNVTQDWTISHPNPFSTTYSGTPGTGTGLTVNLKIESSYTSTLIYTNDDRGMVPPPVQNNPIINARSDQPANKYYQSLWTPSLLQPVQIIMSFSEAKGLAGIKFQATNPEIGKYIGTMAMFGTNIDPIPSLSNIRNSDEWEIVIDRKILMNPFGNENDNWSDWIPTNSFLQTSDVSGIAEYNRYKHYVIEFYSVDDSIALGEDFITINKLKLLYEEDASHLYYENNGKLEIKFPVIGNPGPDGSSDTLTKNLLNTSDFPMYAYDVQLANITSANGYKNGNTLAYVFNQDTTNVVFLVNIVNIDNNVYNITVDDSSTLAGTQYISLNSPVSLDNTKVYTYDLQLDGGKVSTGDGGSGYKANDIVTVNGTSEQLKLRITSVDNSGTVLGIVWMNNITLNNQYNGKLATTLVSSPQGSSGSGLKVTVTPNLASGEGGIPGKGATIQITSSNNLQVEASFTGNRIDTQSINSLDQPIINKYNHFTTYLEFKQPEIVQTAIKVEIELEANTTINSGIILQNVRNNVTSLFDITPNYMGKGLKLSDIYKAILDTPYVKWCRVLTPLDNIDINENELLILSNLDIIEIIPVFK